MLQIIDSGITFSRSQLADHFPDVSAPAVLSASDLVHLGLIEIADTADAIATRLSQAKAEKNAQINAWREAANLSTFSHNNTAISCDSLSQRDIDKVLGTVARTGAFPPGFPNAWKAADNTYLPLPSVAAFDAMYAAMVGQGMANFAKSEGLKAALAAATTMAQIDAIAWD